MAIQNEELLQDYITACTNLYGMAAISLVAQMYSEHNDVHLSTQQLKEYIRTPRVTQLVEERLIYMDADHFIAEAVSEPDEQSQLKKAAAGKPVYIPGKTELLKYTDERYFEKTEPQKELKERIIADFGPDAAAEDAVAELVMNLQVSGGDFTPVLSHFLSSLSLPSEQAEPYIPLVIHVANTTRLWENNGHTFAELP